jgi:hypothetical protein
MKLLEDVYRQLPKHVVEFSVLHVCNLLVINLFYIARYPEDERYFYRRRRLYRDRTPAASCRNAAFVEGRAVARNIRTAVATTFASDLQTVVSHFNIQKWTPKKVESLLRILCRPQAIHHRPVNRPPCFRICLRRWLSYDRTVASAWEITFEAVRGDAVCVQSHFSSTCANQTWSHNARQTEYTKCGFLTTRPRS